MNRVQPAWRSLLFVPVLSERFLAKAHARGADAIILDLEDSILPANKAAARAALPAAVPRVAQGGVRRRGPHQSAARSRGCGHRGIGHARRRRPDAAEGHGPRACPAARRAGDRPRGRARHADRPHALPRPDRIAGGAAASLRHRRRAAHGRHVGRRRGHGDRARRHPLGRQHVCLRHAGPGRVRARRASCRWDRWASSRISTTSTPIGPA